MPMHFKNFLSTIPKIKQAPLPKEKAHLKMIPPNRKMDFLRNKIGDAPREAAVLCLFYPNTLQETEFVLILRKTYQGVHSAQIGFPGGKIEKEDAGFEQAALRETEEEIGVYKRDITIFKTMTKVYIPPSNFMVYPFLAYLDHEPVFKKDDYEVEKIIRMPLKALLKTENITKKQVQTSYGITIEVPMFILQDIEVWGATAMMLSEIKMLFNHKTIR
jgi:8-oxo-dGTP pyrophosphatase MutT (NUDIX family)